MSLYSWQSHDAVQLISQLEQAEGHTSLSMVSLSKTTVNFKN